VRPKTLSHRLKDDRLPLLVIANNQKHPPLSSAAIRTTSEKTWDGGGFSVTNAGFRGSMKILAVDVHHSPGSLHARNLLKTLKIDPMPSVLAVE